MDISGLGQRIQGLGGKLWGWAARMENSRLCSWTIILENSAAGSLVVLRHNLPGPEFLGIIFAVRVPRFCQWRRIWLPSVGNRAESDSPLLATPLNQAPRYGYGTALNHWPQCRLTLN